MRGSQSIATVLAKKAMKGDRGAFEELCRLKEREILFVAMTMLGAGADADDAAQETMIRMFQHIGALRNAESIDAWIGEITRRCCIDVLRKRQRRFAEADVDDESIVIEETNREFLPPEYAEDEALSDKLYEIVCALPEKRREAILMYYYENLNYRQIANATDTTVQTVSTNLLKARKMIKEELENGKGTKDLLSGAATSTVLSRVLEQQAAKHISDAHVAAFEAKWTAALKGASYPIKAGSAAGVKIAVSVTAAAAVCAIATLGVMANADQAPNAPTPVSVADAGADVAPDPGDRAIAFVSNDCECGHINPTDIFAEALMVGDSELVWEIRSEDGASLLFSGDRAGAIQKILEMRTTGADGRYLAICQMLDKDDATIMLRRNFTIGNYHGDA